jgi:hypothetical protein
MAATHPDLATWVGDNLNGYDRKAVTNSLSAMTKWDIAGAGDGKGDVHNLDSEKIQDVLAKSKGMAVNITITLDGKHIATTKVDTGSVMDNLGGTSPNSIMVRGFRDIMQPWLNAINNH